MTKLESIASSAVRAADKVGAALIIVYTQSGTSALQSSKLPFKMPSLFALQMVSFCFRRLLLSNRLLRG